MNNSFQQQIEKKAPRPHSLFMIDGLGALLSAMMLGVVLIQFQPYFGIPVATLYLLAAIPCVFVLYDAFCYFTKPQPSSRYLRIIAIANLLYCAFSLAVAFFHFEKLTLLGWLYIIGEVLIVVGLAGFELQVAGRLDKSK